MSVRSFLDLHHGQGPHHTTDRLLVRHMPLVSARAMHCGRLHTHTHPTRVRLQKLQRRVVLSSLTAYTPAVYQPRAFEPTGPPGWLRVGDGTPPRSLPVIGFDVLCAPVMSYSVPQCLLYCPPESPDRVPRTAQRRARLCTVGQPGSHWGRLHTHTHLTRVRLVWSSPLGATDGCPVLAATQLTYPSRASVRYTLGSLHALI